MCVIEDVDHCECRGKRNEMYRIASKKESIKHEMSHSFLDG